MDSHSPDDLILLALRLYGKTQDPMLPQAVEVILRAGRTGVEDAQAINAMQWVLGCRDAYEALYGEPP